MKKILLVGALLLGLGWQACAKKEVIEIRALAASFDKIESRGKLTLELTQGSTDEVSVETEAEWQKGVSVAVEEGTLKLATTDAFNNRRRLHGTVRITFKSLSSLDVKGVGDVSSTTTIAADKLDVRLKGVGNAALHLNARQLSVSSKGVGNVQLRGEAEEAQLKKTGVGNMDAEKLKTKKLRADISGIGNLEVHASQKLRVNSTGIGSVRYSGGAKSYAINNSVLGGVYVHNKHHK